MINFNASNGQCPFYLNGMTRYFIQDKKIDNKWDYRLMSKDLTSELMTFCNSDIANIFVESDVKIHLVNRSLKTTIYESDTKEYFVKGRQVSIGNKSVVLSDSFAKYLDCLEWSKEYVESIIKSDDKQIKLEGLG